MAIVSRHAVTSRSAGRAAKGAAGSHRASKYNNRLKVKLVNIFADAEERREREKKRD
jgi:hypothetical protein